MKKIGVILFLAGFGWLCWMQLSAVLVGERPGLRVLLTKHDALHDQTLAKEVAERIGREAVSAQCESVPMYGLPATLMLLGGLLISLYPRGHAVVARVPTSPHSQKAEKNDVQQVRGLDPQRRGAFLLFFTAKYAVVAHSQPT